MPCYEPPPPWEEANERNALQAVKLLCELVKNDLKHNKPLSKELLTWFLEHRTIDYQIATTQYFGTPNQIDAQNALDDIIKVKKLLESKNYE